MTQRPLGARELNEILLDAGSLAAGCLAPSTVNDQVFC
jgi:hypothetical protein